MWSIRTLITLLLFSECDSRFSAECTQGYIEILEFIFIQDSNHARGTKVGKLNYADVMRSGKMPENKVPDLAGAWRHMASVLEYRVGGTIQKASRIFVPRPITLGNTIDRMSLTSLLIQPRLGHNENLLFFTVINILALNSDKKQESSGKDIALELRHHVTMLNS